MEVWITFRQTSDQYGTEEIVSVHANEESARLEVENNHSWRMMIKKYDVKFGSIATD